jgi:putative salt-induced outer membrane protein YdiY
MKKQLCLFVGLTAHALAASSAGDYLNSLSLSTSPGSPWELTGAAGLGLSKGNSDSLSYSLQVLGTYAQGENEGLVGADLLYSESNGIASTNSFRLFGQYNRLHTERFYSTVNGSFLTDDIADLNYRIDLGVGLGYYVVKNETTSLAFEAGPGFAWEDQGGVSRDFMTVRFGERFEHQLSSRSKIWQSAVFAPKANDFSDYLLTAEAGIDTLLTRDWALRTSVRYQYDSTPAAGRQSDDTTLLMGLSYALGGFPDPEEEGRQTLHPGAAAPEAVQLGWSTSAALGVALASGNSDSLTVSLSADSAYREDVRELFLTGAYTFAEDGGNTSADALRASAQFNRLLNDRVFLGAGLGYLRDDVADITYRATPVLTLGYYLIKNDEMTLSFEAGPGYTFEEVGGLKDDYFSVVAAEKFTWELSDRMTLKQSLSAVLDPSDTDNYTLVGDVFLDTNITNNLAWRIAAGWSYDNQPAQGRGKDDTTLTTGVSVKF